MRLEARRDYFDFRRIVALSSGLGGGAIAVVRCSGSGSLEALKALSEKTEISPRLATRVFLRDSSGAPIDEAVVIFYPASSSFTGEDLVEYNTHSNPYIVERLIETLIKQFQFANALPGEFSFRAVKNGKISLFQADAIRDIISSDNQTALSHSLEKVRGQRGKEIEALDAALEHLLILTEAGIDFSDQNLDEVSIDALQFRLNQIRSTLTELVAGYQKGRRIQEGVEAAIIGIPNAGKSSLFNLLLRQDRAIVTDVPGTTRDLIHEKLMIQDYESGFSATLVLKDTAGIRNTTDKVESIGIGKSLRSILDADLVLCVVDPVASIHDQVRETFARVSGHEKKVIVLFSKADLVTLEQRIELEDQFKSFNYFWVSAVTREGLLDLERGILKFCRRWLERQPGEVFLTRVEQEQAVLEAIIQIDAMHGVTDLDIFASEIRRLASTLSIVSGKRETDDILSGIFSKFCIGK